MGGVMGEKWEEWEKRVNIIFFKVIAYRNEGSDSRNGNHFPMDNTSSNPSTMVHR